MNKKTLPTVLLVFTLVLIAIIGTIVILNSTNPNTKPQTEENHNKNEHNVTENPYTTPAEPTTISFSKIGFENPESWGRILVKITPTTNGKYIFTDEKGDFVVIIKDNNIFWEFYSSQNQLITNSLKDDFTFDSSSVINYTPLSNDKISVVESFDSYTISITKRFTVRNIPILEILDASHADYFIPYEYIDTSRPFEFYKEGKTYGKKSYHYYKFYLK